MDDRNIRPLAAVITFVFVFFIIFLLMFIKNRITSKEKYKIDKFKCECSKGKDVVE